MIRRHRRQWWCTGLRPLGFTIPLGIGIRDIIIGVGTITIDTIGLGSITALIVVVVPSVDNER